MQTKEKPYIAGVEPTNHCPYRCVMCPRGEGLMTRPLKHIEMDTLRRVLAHVPDHQRLLRLYQFGEPVLHPRLMDVIEETAQSGVLPMIAVNPASLTTKTMDALARSSLAVVWLSIDALTDEGLQKIRGIKGGARSWDRVHEFIARTRSAGRPILKVIFPVRMEDNAHEEEAFYALKNQYPEPDVEVHIIENHGWGDLDRVRRTCPSGVARLQALARACHAPFDEVTVLSNGDVVICCFDYNGVRVIGNVLEKSLPEIWQDEPVTKLREQFRSRSTADLALCGGCYLAPHSVPEGRDPYTDKGFCEEQMILEFYDAMTAG